MRRIRKALPCALFIAAVFASGFIAGLSVKVFMARGVPVIHGGGEIMLLLAIPAAVYIGYRLGSRKKERGVKK